MRILTAVVIFTLTFFAYANVSPQDPFNPQHITRTALALSLSEGRIDIDRLAPYTIDKAFFEGHYYSDKQPGLSLLATPVVAATRVALDAIGSPSDPTNAGTDPKAAEALATYVRVAAVATVSLPAALAVMLVYLMARHLGVSQAAATFASCALALGTPFFGWSSTMFAHSLSGAMLFGAVALIVMARASPRTTLLTGLLLGLTLVVDITTAPAAALIGVFLLARSEARLRDVLLLGAAGMVGLLPLLIYNQVAISSPFRLGYSQVQGFEGMQQGFFGVTFPAPMVAGELLFGRFRGLLPLAPVLLLVPIGLWAMLKSAATRGVAMVIAGTFLCFLLINSSYFYWDGGSSTGPRHIVASLPLAALALAFAWPPGWPAKVVALLLLAVSLGISMVTAFVDAMSPPWFGNPFFDYLLPGFLSGGWMQATIATVVVWLGFLLVALLPGARGEGLRAVRWTTRSGRRGQAQAAWSEPD